jgi:GNAT superfamily N-acetyltransferase
LRNSDGGNSEHSGDSSRPDDAQAEATNESNLVELTSAASSDSAGEQQSMDVNGREPRRAALFAVGGKLGTLPATTGSPRPSASSVSEDDSGAELHSAIEAAQNPLPRDLQLRARSRILNEQHLGSIVDVRYNPERQQFEYYIHFDGWNKRLDEWLSVEDLDLSDLPQRIAEHTRRARERQERRRSRTSNTPSVGKRQVKTETATSVENEHDSASLQTPSMAAERGRSTNVSSDVMTRVKNLHSIVIGRWEIETWYYSPLPPEFCNLRTLYICEFTLKFFRSRDGLARHLARNTRWHPPGQEIYRKENLAVFQVDGARNRFYCQNVCYLSKLFLDHKTLYYDVDPFWFYILCELDSYGYHFVGYFSKEKASEEHYNVACILTLPPYQRKGYGKFLIALSYELSRREGIRGSPEKPLSDLGLLGYRSYWSQVLIDLLTEAKAPLSIEEIADRTMMKTEDIIGTLRALDLVHYHEGQHIIDLRRVQHMRLGHRGMPFDPACLRWSPPVGRKRRIN